MDEQLPEHQPKTMRVQFIASGGLNDPYHGTLQYKGRCVCGRETPWCSRKRDAEVGLATHIHANKVGHD